MKKLQWIAPTVACLALLFVVGAQYQANQHLRSDLAELQERYVEIENTLAFSQLLRQDVETELQELYEEQNHPSVALGQVDAIQFSNRLNLTEQDRYELERFKLGLINPDGAKTQANTIVNQVYSAFINDSLNDVETRIKARNILEAVEERRSRMGANYLLGKTAHRNTGDELAYSEQLYSELSSVLSVDEMAAFIEFREKEIPKYFQNRIERQVSRLASGLNEESRKLLINSMLEIRMMEFSDLSTEQLVRQPIEAVKLLRSRVADLESEQARIAADFIDQRYRGYLLQDMLLDQHAGNHRN